MAERVLILGASARAAAASARRAGLDPFAIDLFADRDTKQICEVHRCPFEDYPEGLFRLARTAPPMPWMYTGGLENYPELVGELAKERELWGNGAEVLKQVRGPRRLESTLSGRAFFFPKIVSPGESAEPGKWLRKPLRGAGGIDVNFAMEGDIEQIQSSECKFYLEEYISGQPMSAQFAAGSSWCDLCSVTTQLIGTPWLHADHFAYSGNIICPANDTDPVVQFFLTLADAGRPPVVHVWGLDFIRTSDRIYPVDLNPRYTASMELLEFATNCSILAYAMDVPQHPTGWQLTGKAIYYAPARLTFPTSGPWDDSLARAADVWTRPDFADIPHPGDVIEAGQPILTILTDADTEVACLAKLKARAAELDRLFGFATPIEDEPCRP